MYETQAIKIQYVIHSRLYPIHMLKFPNSNFFTYVHVFGCTSSYSDTPIGPFLYLQQHEGAKNGLM